jgi:exodeoxyribonuclease VII large subunit
MDRRLGQKRRALDEQRRALQRIAPQARIDSYRQQVDDLTRRASRTLRHGQVLRRSNLAGLGARLAALSPQATLKRGYAIVRREDTGAVVRCVDQVSSGDEIAIRVQDGEFGAVTRSRT